MNSVQIDLEKQVNILLKEAEIYKAQGLLAEAKATYGSVAQLIQENGQFAHEEGLLEEVSEEVSALERDLNRIKGAAASPHISAGEQDVIKELFSFSDDKNSDGAKLEGAKALSEFGQFERALIEFNDLVKRDSLRVVAAENVLRCLAALSLLDVAVSQYKEWASSDLFSPEQLEKLQVFLQDILSEKGSDIAFSHAKGPVTYLSEEREQLVSSPLELEDAGNSEGEGEDLIEISLVEIPLVHGTQMGRRVDIKVDFQARNRIRVMISQEEKELMDHLRVGLRINDVRFYASFATFKGALFVTARNRINSGTRKGYCVVDMRVDAG